MRSRAKVTAVVLLLSLMVGGCAGTGQPAQITQAEAPKEAAAPRPSASLATPSAPEQEEEEEHDGHQGGHHHDAELVALPDGVEPERLRIPAIGVDADVIELGLAPDQSLEVPQDFAQAGWFTGGPRPGRLGAAIIAGHVDSREGPAVFFRLRELRAGDAVEVVGGDGQVVSFTVEEVEQYPKDGFPTERVYGYTRTPVLRLITCGGDFDRAAGSYRDNIVVYATVNGA